MKRCFLLIVAVHMTMSALADEQMEVDAALNMPEKANRACRHNSGSFVLSSRPCTQLAATLDRIRARQEILEILSDDSWNEMLLAQNIVTTDQAAE